jgi:CBS domain-containing protein
MSKTARDVMTPATAQPAEADAGRVIPGGRPTTLVGNARMNAIAADDWVDQALATMTELKVRRLPVIDRGRLVGTVSQGDLARSIEQPDTWSWLCS